MPEPSSDAAVREGVGDDDRASPGPARGQEHRRRVLLLLGALGLALPTAARARVVPGTPGEEVSAPGPGCGPEPWREPAVHALPDLGAAAEERVRDEAGRELSLRSLLVGRVTVLVLALPAVSADPGGVATVPAAALLEGLPAAGVQFLAVLFGPAPDRRAAVAAAVEAAREGAGRWRWRWLAAAGAGAPADGFGVLVVDRGGRVRGWYGPGLPVAGLVLADLRALLAEEEA
jgi:hypothetical protein